METQKNKTKVSAKFGTGKGGPSVGELESLRRQESYEKPLGPIGTEADHPAHPISVGRGPDDPLLQGEMPITGGLRGS